MKKLTLTLLALVMAASLSHASTTDTYTATADPNASPNAVDSNNVNSTLWALSNPGGSSAAGSFFISGTPPSWALYSITSEVTATAVLPGGALSVGQSVGLNFNNQGIASGHEVGINILSGNAVEFSLYFLGAGPGVYQYSDSNGTGQDTTVGYAYQGETPFSFTLTGASTYSASFGGDTWTGNIANGTNLTGISVFNDAEQSSSNNVFFDTLSVSQESQGAVPEPKTTAMLIAGLGALFFWMRRKSKQA